MSEVRYYDVTAPERARRRRVLAGIVAGGLALFAYRELRQPAEKVVVPAGTTIDTSTTTSTTQFVLPAVGPEATIVRITLPEEVHAESSVASETAHTDAADTSIVTDAAHVEPAHNETTIQQTDVTPVAPPEQHTAPQHTPNAQPVTGTTVAPSHTPNHTSPVAQPQSTVLTSPATIATNPAATYETVPYSAPQTITIAPPAG